MNEVDKKNVIRVLSLLQDRMPQTIILYGFSQKIIDTALILEESLDKMEVLK